MSLVILRGLAGRRHAVGVLLDTTSFSAFAVSTSYPLLTATKLFCSNPLHDRPGIAAKTSKTAAQQPPEQQQPSLAATAAKEQQQQQQHVAAVTSAKPAAVPPPVAMQEQQPQPTKPPAVKPVTSAASAAISTAAATYSPQQIRKNVRSYVFGRYIDYIKNYDEVLEKKFPAAMKVYRVFAVGIKDFYHDMKRFLKITRIVNTTTQGLRALTRRELELYYQMPKDMLRVAPVLMLSALPFANYVIFPVAYMFPKHFLTPHFWSIQQRYQFQLEMLHDRLQHQLPVFRFMQGRLRELRGDDDAFRRMRHVLGKLGAGQHPSVDEVQSLTSILSQSPYNLQSLPRSVMSNLCALHGIHRGIRKRSRLAYHAYVIHHMDLAIRREGGVHNMPLDALVRACQIRGLNTTNMSTAAMIDWLRQWVDLSIPVKGENISLFLFLPIFIAYNHPNNWKLLYKK